MKIRAESATSFTFPWLHIQPVLLISFFRVLSEFGAEGAEIFHDVVHGFLIGELHLTFSHGGKKVIEGQSLLMSKKLSFSL